jgi:hypothetical protein
VKFALHHQRFPRPTLSPTTSIVDSKPVCILAADNVYTDATRIYTLLFWLYSSTAPSSSTPVLIQLLHLLRDILAAPVIEKTPEKFDHQREPGEYKV